MLVLAHGGGAPEALEFGAPVVMVLVFVLLERRARRKAREQGNVTQSDDPVA